MVAERRNACKYASKPTGFGRYRFRTSFHPTRLSLYPELTARLSLLNEDSSFGKQLNRIYIELLRSQETEKIDKKMREEIIPEMMRNVNIMRNMKFGFEENPEENDLNPDWEKLLKVPDWETRYER